MVFKELKDQLLNDKILANLRSTEIGETKKFKKYKNDHSHTGWVKCKRIDSNDYRISFINIRKDASFLYPIILLKIENQNSFKLTQSINFKALFLFGIVGLVFLAVMNKFFFPDVQVQRFEPFIPFIFGLGIHFFEYIVNVIFGLEKRFKEYFYQVD
ncbi:hypothetical protein KMW28_22785 [Flammeovirga yaeyamensis]|uniref:Uncharacterized protein n=1 Tax=Flammeovirga yaeyamensis TaxID=367791 RepID=A0AAX1NCD0_9BACT|nr:hypothetical protein [Flammeovirga yaeyamensis]MBB3696811.1 hypothetical protein [Flammeovirga yaeyamensis]NMF33476.1 hypothetical protein [Flammeovirga yaeyamensis]QWG05250.1 hypothetical protein KMW28_22785 [Flammeovirga yaeyamensis]